MINQPLRFLLLTVAGWMNRKQQDVIAYLQEGNRVLREQLCGKRLRFTDDQRRRLAAKAKKMSRKKLMEKHFVESVLDQQLAAIAGGDPLECDGADLVFAAASHGTLNDWQDDRLSRAETSFKKLITRDGGILCHLPIQSLEKGLELYTIGAEIIRTYGYMLEHIDSTPDPEYLRRFQRRFRQRAGRSGDPKELGWNHQMTEHPDEVEWWTTALVVHALFRLIRMLDRKINERVFQHFLVRNPKDQKLSLEDLFYADTGLVAHYGESRKHSISGLVQGMYAHLRGVPGPKDVGEPVCSAVLHGPPGTGKTTLLQALSRSAWVPMIEVTPSDIVRGGMEQLERHARNVFEALCMVRRCVVLFDEFDPVLKRRDPTKTEESVYSFLTPGMLPKLRRLNEHADNHHVVYALATNRIGTLDRAAIRPGRFDAKLGIYPPDLLARTGRLVSQLAGEGDLAPGWRERLAEVVQGTAQGPMTTLGKPGWFTADPKGRWRRPGSVLHWIVAGGERPKVKTIPDEECPDRPAGEDRHVKREWEEWRWVVEWDKKIRGPNWSALCRALRDRPAASTPGAG